MSPQAGSSSVQVITNFQCNQNELTEWRVYVVEEYLWYRVTEIFMSDLTFMFVNDVTFS